MRAALMGMVFSSLALGQSFTPSHWRYAPPEPALLVGIDWRQVSQSNLAGLSAGIGANLDFAEEMTTVLVAVEPGAAGPRFLATASGRFNLTKLRVMAAAEGARTGRYRGLESFSAGGGMLAIVDPRLILVGDTESVRAAVDRGGVATPRETPLWRRAAELSANYSIWAASPSLDAFQPAGAPTPLANLRSFDGGIAFNRGLAVGFDLVMASEESAAALETQLRSAQPPALRDLFVRRQGPKLNLTAFLDSAQMQAGLKTLLASGPPPPSDVMDWIVKGASPAVATPQVAPAPALPPGKRVIRIVGLEDGTREIPFPARP